MLGGTWLTALSGDLGAGKFDGANLIANFEQLNPANTFFVSGKVASKEYSQFVSCMEMIEAVPPGLYEATITEVGENTENSQLIDGKYLFRLEARTLDNIRAFGVNSADDDKRFAAVARISEINLSLYRTFVEPWVRAMTTEQTAEALREMHPHRFRFRVFSDDNPLMAPIKAMALEARANRKPVSAENPFLGLEKATSEWITVSLQSLGEIRDALTEATFLNTYGSPLLQGLVGLNADPANAPRRIEREAERERAEAELHAALEHQFETGTPDEGALRALIYIRKPEGAIDERGFRMAKIIRDSRKANERLSLPQFKEIAKQQLQLVRLDEGRALKALPKLIRPGEPESDAALDALRALLVAPGPLANEEKSRVARVETALGVKLTRAWR